ncbi:Thymus-specific serine protease [Lamellibrachia satsuma]|nr:Thymus-specific serine protease [Lamellibrachia satsuma]
MLCAYVVTYRQRFWVNQEFWKSPCGPVFLYIGGEGGLTSLTVQRGEHVELAEKYGALVFAVEHRYYGKSINKDGLKLTNMRFLSSQQALADLASFHSFAAQKYKLSEKNIWICYGGSYPGSLSAWFRLKYPQLVYGAIASSAPVRAKVNFEGYHNVITSSLSDPIVNGSFQCVLKVKEAFKAVDLLISEHRLAKLEKDFSSCKPLDVEKDIFWFAANLADIFDGVVQYNNEMPTMNISTLCNIMTRPGVPYDNLIALNKKTQAVTNQSCTDNSWSQFLAQVSNTSVRAQEDAPGLRQWLYQTCSQFGYYQTCDPKTTCVFSKHITLEPNLELCQVVYRIAPDEVYRRIKFTNSYYGSDQPKGSRIVFVNGSIDPWHALSVLRDLSTTETAIYINGTAHCANMDGAQPSDPQPLRMARQRVDSQVGSWLKEAGGHHQAKDTTLHYT